MFSCFDLLSFFFQEPPTPETYTNCNPLPLHDARPFGPLAQDLRAGSATDRRSHGEAAMEPDAQYEPDEQSPAQEPVDPERDLAHVAAYERRLVAGLRRQDRQLSSCGGGPAHQHPPLPSSLAAEGPRVGLGAPWGPVSHRTARGRA